MGRLKVRRPILRVTSDGSQRRPDTLAAEEPLEIRIDGQPTTVTMRTPGHDVELAHGFLSTEGLIAQSRDIRTARYCDSPGPDGRNTYNVLDILLSDGIAPPDMTMQRNFYTTSSCGVCGKAALDAVRLRTQHPPADDPLCLTPEALSQLPDSLRQSQRVFDATGGLHAAGLFDSNGTLLVSREDVGRHNAVDKVVGWAVLHDRVPLTGTVLMVSGRASFELVQKAAMVGIPMLAAVSAPSSLAVDLAEEQGMTLVGFLRGNTMNVYTGWKRVSIDETAELT